MYQGNNLCIYYDTNSWNFTRIGKIDNATQEDIKNFVKAGGGDVTVKLSLTDSTLIGDVNGDGELSIADVTSLIDILLSNGSSSSVADVNNDGEVSIGDVTALINILLRKQSSRI